MAMTNAEWMIKNGYNFSDVHVWYSCSKSDEFVVRIKEKKIDTFKSKLEFPETDEAFVEWLDMEHKEYKEPILDDVEKRYLNGVIRPFRDCVQYIVKYDGKFSSGAYEEIAVIYQDKMIGVKHCLLLPKFDKGTMYKGMEIYRRYTPEELNL